MKAKRGATNKRFYDLCVKLAKEHPDWSEAQVEAKATVLMLGKEDA